MIADNQTKTLPNFADLWQHTLKWEPTESQQQQFQDLYQQILLGNAQLNLTRITEPEDFWEKHLWDSLAGLLAVTNETPSLSVIDIGTGGGFPGIPVAIAHPDWQVTLLDSTRKKINFLALLIEELKLENLKTLAARAEEVGRNQLHRDSYDLALIRAVGGASICAEYALPLVKPDGFAILYRGHWSEEETEALQPALTQLGAKIEAIYQLSTPITNGDRHCIYLRKLIPTPPEYPRAIGIPTQHPL